MKNRCRFNFFERLIIVALFILAFGLIIGVIESKAMSPRSTFDYSKHPHWIKSECRELNRYRGRVNYTRALQCVYNTVDILRREEMNKAQLEAIKANTELSRELTKKIKRR